MSVFEKIKQGLEEGLKHAKAGQGVDLEEAFASINK